MADADNQILQAAQSIPIWPPGDLFPTYSGYNSACSFALSSPGSTVHVASDSGLVGVNVTNYCAWIATSDSTWLTLNFGGSGVGSGFASYAVAANPGASSRTGMLTLGGQQFLITQAGSAPASCTTTGDTALTVVNAQLVVNESLGALTPIHDVNHDGAVNVVDIQRMIDAVLGLPRQG